MGKTLFILELPEPAVRKALAPPLKKHKNKKLYSRKTKHKKILRDPGGFFCAPRRIGAIRRSGSRDGGSARNGRGDSRNRRSARYGEAAHATADRRDTADAGNAREFARGGGIFAFLRRICWSMPLARG